MALGIELSGVKVVLQGNKPTESHSEPLFTYCCSTSNGEMQARAPERAMLPTKQHLAVGQAGQHRSGGEGWRFALQSLSLPMVGPHRMPTCLEPDPPPPTGGSALPPGLEDAGKGDNNATFS